jgi:acetyl-CoA carboxylase biotin carboxyl carrier protein
MQLEEVKALLTQFDQSSLTEFDLREGSFELYMNKNKAAVKHSGEKQEFDITASRDLPTNEFAPTASAVTYGTPDTTPEKTALADTENTTAIVSPIVGVAYLKPAPDQENFVKVGDAVKKGDVVCIIEAMKLMNEITATDDGIVTEILVENEAVVEFNQPLFRIAKGA